MKGATNMRTIFLAVLLFGAMLVGIGSFVGGLSENYGYETSMPVFDKGGEINTTMTQLQSLITSGNVVYAIVGFFLMPVTIIILMFQSVGWVNEMISVSLADSIGFAVPAWFIGFVEVGAFVVIAFTILNIMSGRSDA